MSTKYLKYVFAIMLLLIAYIILSFVQSRVQESSLLDYVRLYDTSLIVDNTAVKCSMNIFNLEVAYIELSESEMKNELAIYYYDLKNPLRMDKSDWDNAFVGSTKVDNISYEELIALVRHDCNMFKESGEILGNSEKSWNYLESNSYTINKDTYKEREGELKADEVRGAMNLLSGDQQERLKNMYGDWTTMNDNEILKWSDILEENAEEIRRELGIQEVEIIESDPLFDNYERIGETITIDF